VEELNNQIAEKQKSAVLISDRLDKASEVYDSILNWGNKVAGRLDDSFNLKVASASQIEDT